MLERPCIGQAVTVGRSIERAICLPCHVSGHCVSSESYLVTVSYLKHRQPPPGNISDCRIQTERSNGVKIGQIVVNDRSPCLPQAFDDSTNPHYSSVTRRCRTSCNMVRHLFRFHNENFLLRPKYRNYHEIRSAYITIEVIPLSLISCPSCRSSRRSLNRTAGTPLPFVLSDVPVGSGPSTS